MKRALAAIVLMTSSATALARDGVRFDAVLSESGREIARPSVWVSYGEPAVIEVPGKIRVVASADTPSGERSVVKAEIFQFVDGAWVSVSKPSMVADLSKTPSFEQDIKDGPYRVVVMPRMAAQPAKSGS